jgi:hypothetical protein
MPQLYVIPVESVTGFGCHQRAYRFKSAELPNTIKRQTAKMKQHLFAARFLKIQPAISKIIIQFQGDKSNDKMVEAN